ncbi:MULTISPECIES: TetR/AcrR family transcriptional regulator [unclassified Acinetobacter]|uniref:TetR/AcrR family transcriptional regulator n=1 Tax=unclassified Acinetobacter TaxID=196816 RepID=UPI00293529A6|nr:MULTISPECIES: TetR/AcrR family transcriptional regulator [unclassified Acinetobacter]WOE31007.1 TetR/AcrR family transcriptional regulator [Acinetobacter sp. SAAs470]WOE39203.1 TetR/AcrR family transcriptional regulator [Acinetobacter sp. SAAs474]
MQPSQAKKSQDKRNLILENSFDLVLCKGFFGVGLQEILKNCHVPKGSFYYYFQSKEAFGCALLEHYIQHYHARLTELWSNHNSAQDRILSYFNAWIYHEQSQCGWAEKCLIVKLAAEVADLSEDMRLIMDTSTKDLIARIAYLITQGQQDGSVKNQLPAHDVAQIIYQMWLGAALLSKLQKDKTPLQHAMQATKFMLNPSHTL